MTDSYLGSFSIKHVFFSSIFAGFSGIALTQLVSRHYKGDSSLFKLLKYLVLGYLTSIIFFSLGVRNLTLLSFIICLSYLIPLFLVLFTAFKNIKKRKFKKITIDGLCFFINSANMGNSLFRLSFFKAIREFKVFYFWLFICSSFNLFNFNYLARCY
jgi:hypothetical protein|tara:strand:+ start:469 stop:939 length:471 start_codon:yes stop_codon:yes gene_type:complete